MAYYEITGGVSLSGEIIPQGAKNEALEVICATLLTEEKVVIKNVPEISDVINLIGLMQDIGVKVSHIEKNVYAFEAQSINFDYLKTESFRQKSAKLRGSVMIVGPLLARFGYAFLPKPGGDKIGRRHLDTHFIGLKKLGAEFSFDVKNSSYTINGKNLKGTYILLEEASITGTANVVMAAVLAKGETTIFNAACEPYICQLCKMLVLMGANILGIGSNLLKISGVSSLKGCNHRCLPDMIEIGSFIGLAAMTGSEIRIKNVSRENLGLIPNAFRKLGIVIKEVDDDIIVPKQDRYEISSYIDGSILTIADAPWPGLTPDLLSVLLVVATQAKGSVLIHQKMFESRLFFVDKLIDMGAQIILCDPHRATVIGLDHKFALKATTMTSPDIRAGVALLIAALSAEGKSIIYNIEQIDRGYENLEDRLKALGAKIKRYE
ncbi:MAG: UDP-N-acetylglucosamine 1-carboxyvinyltransferase [Bacteroidales bacterium]|nr:UDP-N-acetylglucosamine 1-carboxyvinyltransferase [Bacteroidales bacterium]